MSKQEMQEQTEETKPAGFFERRWRMVKAAAKQAYEYLFDVKTYVYAGAMLGTALLLNNTDTGMSIAKSLGMPDGFLGMKAGMDAVGFMMHVGQFVALSTVLRTGVAMAKESYACNNCRTGVSAPNVDTTAKQSTEQAIEQQQSYSQYELDHGYVPTPLPQPTNQHGQKPPSIGM